MTIYQGGARRVEEQVYIAVIHRLESFKSVDKATVTNAFVSLSVMAPRPPSLSVLAQAYVRGCHPLCPHHLRPRCLYVASSCSGCIPHWVDMSYLRLCSFVYAYACLFTLFIYAGACSSTRAIPLITRTLLAYTRP